MTVKVFIDGAIHDPEDAHISVFDRGFLYGDSVYEVLRTSGGRPVDLEPHLDRLERSAASIALELPERDLITRAVAEILRAAGNPESYLRIIVTRGGGDINLDPAAATGPSLILIARPLALLAEESYRHGVSLRIVGVRRVSARAVDPAVKSGNYLNSILALHEARKAGAYEAIMCDAQGRVAEGASSNLFVVRGQEIITPANHIGLLLGITRARIMELSRDAGIEIVHGELMPEDVRAADEVFITSSIRGVVPVATVDDQPMPAPVPGPLTQRIMDLYHRYLEAQATAD
jgi:branched-chain amino acid aminotransferase